jgi:hypothetical protein
MLGALLALLKSDPKLREQARIVLGIDVAPVRYVSRKQGAELGVEIRALIRAERAGALVAFKTGRSKVYRLADVVAFVEAHPTPAQVPKTRAANEAGGADRRVG